MISFSADLPLPKIQIKKFPQIDFGVNVQSPEFFHGRRSLISNHSYINPFVDLDLKKIKIARKSEICQRNSDKENWTSRQHHTNLSSLKAQNGHLTGQKDIFTNYHKINNMSQSLDVTQSFASFQQQKQTAFNKKKGEFTTYLENHLLNQDFAGPILGDQRTCELKKKTKQELLQKKQKDLQKIRQKHTLEPRSRQNSPLLQKSRIHRNRLQLSLIVSNSYQAKTSRSKDFQLPKINQDYLSEEISKLESHYKTYKTRTLNKSLICYKNEISEKTESCINQTNDTFKRKSQQLCGIRHLR